MDNNEKYLEICSARTIQSDEQGFFGELCHNVRSNCSQKYVNTVFKNASSDREKLILLFNDPNLCNNLLGSLEHVSPVYKAKNATVSNERRMEGEKLVAKNQLERSLVMFSQAVIRAPAKGVDIRVDGGLSLALALWDRSSVLLDLEDGQAALIDLQLCLANGLPAKQHSEYYVRLAKANALNGDLAKANICLNLVKKLSQNPLEIQRLETVLSFVKPKLNINEPLEMPNFLSGDHSSLNGASNLIDRSSSEKYGQFIVAKERINTGDILLAEEPLAACLLPKYYGTHCLHCMKRLKYPIGCPNCSGVGFCSTKCMETACKTYHRFECKFLDLLLGSGMSILCYVALRLITQSGTAMQAIANCEEIISRLCTNSTIRKPDDFLERCVMSAFLLRILQQGEFFGCRPTEAVDPTSIEMDVCTILLGLLQVMQFNAHEIFETKLGTDGRIIESKPVYIGVGLYNTASSFNHDCYPSVTRYFIGRNIVLRSMHPITIGGMVSENYGPIFTKRNRNERQRVLSARYWFKCDCRSCTENWQILDKLTNKARLICPTLYCLGVHPHPDNPHKTLKCLKCKKMVSLNEQLVGLLKCEELYRKGAELMTEGKLLDAIQSLCDGIDLFYTVAIPPHKHTHIAQDSLKACFANLGTVV